MSRNPTAYFAIVGTLAFALPGAASAGQLNIPHININLPRPQISVPTPHPSISPPRINVPTQGLSNLRMISGGRGTALPTQTLSTARMISGWTQRVDSSKNSLDGNGTFLPQVPTRSENASSFPATPVGGPGGGGSGGGGLHKCAS